MHISCLDSFAVTKSEPLTTNLKVVLFGSSF